MSVKVRNDSTVPQLGGEKSVKNICVVSKYVSK